MGPIEIVFLILLGVWGIIGLVRGYPKELGVTVILCAVLFVLELLDERYQAQLNSAVGMVTNAAAANATRTWIYVVVLIVAGFISYQGQTLSFPGGSGRGFLNWVSGLLNGYLLVGSIWYYLNAANWPGLPIIETYTPLYNAMVRLMPPAIFSWPYFIALVVILLIARVIR